MKHFIEAYSTIDETARITGVALIPRISRNDNLYTKEELRRFDNVKVPLNWEHDGNKQIGSVTFHYNPELETVYYDGEITDDAVASVARNKTLFTSIEANPTEVKEICNGSNDCFSMPFGLIPIGLALTETPGVPETSVNILESYVKKIKECEHDKELERKYAHLIKKGVQEQEREPQTDAIINDFMLKMTGFLEAQIKSKYETLQLYKTILTKNPEDATAKVQAESHMRELKDLIKQLLEVRKDNEFTSPETMPIIKDFENVESICGCCGDFIQKEQVIVSGPHTTPKLDKKKKKRFEFKEELDEHWKLVIQEVRFRSFTHSSSFVGNVKYDQENQSMEIILNGKTYNFCNVSERLFDAFEGATSKGAFFNREIKSLHDC